MHPPHAPGHRALRIGRISDPERSYFVTTAAFAREPLFRAFEPARAMARVLFDPDAWGDATLQAWVLMPDHMHVIVELGAMSLSDVVRRAKGRSAFAFNRALGRRGGVWARAFHDRAIRGEGNLREAARYLVRNPLRAGLVDDLGAYPFWGSLWTTDDGPL